MQHVHVTNTRFKNNITGTQEPIPCSLGVTRTPMLATILLWTTQSNSVSCVLYKNCILQRVCFGSGYFLLTLGFCDLLLYVVVGYSFSVLYNVLLCDYTIMCLPYLMVMSIGLISIFSLSGGLLYKVLLWGFLNIFWRKYTHIAFGLYFWVELLGHWGYMYST